MSIPSPLMPGLRAVTGHGGSWDFPMTQPSAQITESYPVQLHKLKNASKGVTIPFQAWSPEEIIWPVGDLMQRQGRLSGEFNVLKGLHSLFLMSLPLDLGKNSLIVGQIRFDSGLRTVISQT